MLIKIDPLLNLREAITISDAVKLAVKYNSVGYHTTQVQAQAELQKMQEIIASLLQMLQSQKIITEYEISLILDSPIITQGVSND